MELANPRRGSPAAYGPAEPDPAVETGWRYWRSSLLVLCCTWLILEPHPVRMNVNVRAVTQNRAMAACCGVPTGRGGYAGLGLGSVYCRARAAWRCRSACATSA
ncbi:hypothetical protein LNP74_20975 [Klebsiella pneumoniae subsp. pneumoniae]|nr:hypothetical protein [Klebsiella pneumoniae subsp. pneumoniae]